MQIDGSRCLVDEIDKGVHCSSKCPPPEFPNMRDAGLGSISLFGRKPNNADMFTNDDLDSDNGKEIFITSTADEKLLICRAPASA